MEEGENRFGIIIERNVAIPVRDGVVLRANVFRPDTTVSSLGCYPHALRQGNRGLRSVCACRLCCGVKR